MKALLLYGFLPALVLVGGLAWVVARGVRRTPGSRKRSLWLALVAGTLLLLLGCAKFLVGQVRQGVWFCDVCGVEERQITSFGLVLESTPLALDDPEAGTTREYAEWYARSAGLEHTHRWTPAGEHSLGFGAPLTYHEFPPTFHRALPHLADAALARTLVERLAHAPPEERAAMLRDFAQRSSEEGPPALMRALARAPLPPEAFAKDYPSWLAEHPLWAGP